MFLLVVNEIDNVVIIFDVDGFIEYVNNGFYWLMGWELDEVKGKKFGLFL